MFSFKRMWAVARYELTWDMRKKRTFVMLAVFLFSSVMIGYLVPVIIGKAAAANTFANATGNTWWVWVVYLVFNGLVAGLFPLLIGGFISTDTFASEFESRTITPLLSQPIRRMEVYVGKLLEKSILMLGVSVAFTAVSFLAAEASIGGQAHLGWYPWIILISFGAFLEFTALAFFLGSFIRSGSTLLGVMVAVFIGAIIVLGVASLAFGPQPWMLSFPVANVQELVYVAINYLSSPSGTIVLQANLGPGTSSQAITMMVAPALTYVVAGLVINLMVPFALGYLIFARAEVKE